VKNTNHWTSISCTLLQTSVTTNVQY